MKAILTLFKDVVGSLNESLLLVDEASESVIEANPAAVRLYGYSRSELIGKTEADLRAPNRDHRVEPSTSIFHCNREGREFPVQIVSPKTSSFGKKSSTRVKLVIAPISLEQIERDDRETDRLEIYEALRDSQLRFHAIFDSTFQWTGLLQPDGTIVEVNKSSLEFFGLRKEDVSGKLFCEVFWTAAEGNMRERIRDAVRRAAQGEFVRFNVGVIGSGGRLATMDFSLKPFRDNDNRVVLLIPEGRDITANRMHEEEQIRSSKLEALGVLAGGLAHDLNNIMMCISLSLELIRLQSKRGAVDDEPIHDALLSVKRASDLSKRLLTFARGGDPVMAILDPAELITSATNLSLQGSNLEPVLEIEPGLPPIIGDHDQLTQVLDHLVINAREATPSGGKIWISATTTQDVTSTRQGRPMRYIRIEVRDEGVGIAPEIINRIFDPYFTTKPRGTGIGLTTCFSILRRHGGSIQVHSTLGHGATFTCLLPVANESQLPANATKAGEKTAPPLPRGSGRILVIDDDEQLRDTLSRILGLSGFTVTLADKGETGFAAYRKAIRAGTPFDVVLIDATISGGAGGVEALELLRRANPEVCAVIMSGYSNTQVMTEWQELGFRSALHKPFTMEKVVTVLNHLCPKR